MSKASSTLTHLKKTYAKRIYEILSTAEDIEEITAKKVRAQLESEFNVNLKPNKDAINEIITEEFTKVRDANQSDSNSSEEPAVVSSSKKRKADKGATKAKNSKRKVVREKQVVDPNNPKPLTGFNAPYILSPELGAFLKEERLPRTEIIKRLWAYIKTNKLQDPNDGRIILCDKGLEKLFQVDKITSFQMAKVIGPHLTKLSPEELKELNDKLAQDRKQNL